MICGIKFMIIITGDGRTLSEDPSVMISEPYMLQFQKFCTVCIILSKHAISFVIIESVFLEYPAII